MGEVVAEKFFGLERFPKQISGQQRVETFGGGWRTSLPTSRQACECPVLVGLAVLSQPPSKPMIRDQETARSTEMSFTNRYILRTAIEKLPGNSDTFFKD